MPVDGKPGAWRRGVSWAFGVASLVALVIFEQSITAFAAKEGWDQSFIGGWKFIKRIGLGEVVAFAFFSLGGATLALWIEFWFRDRHEEKAKLDRFGISCTAFFKFSKDADGKLNVVLDEKSDNVTYFAWYLNNGGTMHNEAVLLFIEYEKPISEPAVFAHSETDARRWQEFAATDRFAFIQLEGWPEGSVVFQAVQSEALGLNRRPELQVWRPYGPMNVENCSS